MESLGPDTHPGIPACGRFGDCLSVPSLTMASSELQGLSGESGFGAPGTYLIFFKSRVG